MLSHYPGLKEGDPCPYCSNPVVFVKPERKPRNVNKTRSKDQEKRLARAFGMRRQPASGALPGAKADLRLRGQLRAEAKETVKSSYSLKLEDLVKLERESSAEEYPLFMLEFQGVHPFRRYVVMPEWVALALLGQEK
jgi:hypothetical protein